MATGKVSFGQKKQVKFWRLRRSQNIKKTVGFYHLYQGDEEGEEKLRPGMQAGTGAAGSPWRHWVVYTEGIRRSEYLKPGN